MPFEFFTVPLDDSGPAKAELNEFLRSHRVSSIEKRWIERDNEAFWHFCVTFREGQAASSSSSTAPAVTSFVASRKPAATKPKVDYREALSPNDFAIYDRLRKTRETLAAEAHVPVYMVFNNEQLVTMVRQRITTKAALEKLPGVSDGRVGKYGDKMLESLQEAFAQHEAKQGAA